MKYDLMEYMEKFCPILTAQMKKENTWMNWIEMKAKKMSEELNQAIEQVEAENPQPQTTDYNQLAAYHQFVQVTAKSLVCQKNYPTEEEPNTLSH